MARRFGFLGRIWVCHCRYSTGWYYFWWYWVAWISPGSKSLEARYNWKKFLMPWQLKIKGIKNNKQPRNDDHFDRIANISVDSATLAMNSKMDSVCNSLSGILNSIDQSIR